MFARVETNLEGNGLFVRIRFQEPCEPAFSRQAEICKSKNNLMRPYGLIILSLSGFIFGNDFGFLCIRISSHFGQLSPSFRISLLWPTSVSGKLFLRKNMLNPRKINEAITISNTMTRYSSIRNKSFLTANLQDIPVFSSI